MILKTKLQFLLCLSFGILLGCSECFQPKETTLTALHEDCISLSEDFTDQYGQMGVAAVNRASSYWDLSLRASLEGSCELQIVMGTTHRKRLAYYSKGTITVYPAEDLWTCDCADFALDAILVHEIGHHIGKHHGDDACLMNAEYGSLCLD